MHVLYIPHVYKVDVFVGIAQRVRSAAAATAYAQH